MEGWTRDKIINIIAKDMDRINTWKDEIKKAIEEVTQENLEFLEALREQIKNSSSGPLISKTPKVLRKRNLKRIETIPEDDTVDISQIVTNATTKKEYGQQDDDDDDEVFEPPAAGRRSKREASKKAGDIIKRQQSVNLNAKMRRPSNEDNEVSRLSKASSRESSSKRLRSGRSSDEEEAKKPIKQIKKESLSSGKRSTRNKPSVDEPVSNQVEVEAEVKPKKTSSMKRKLESPLSRASKRTSSHHGLEPESKKANIIDETLDASADETIESSMYEDAIGKAVPIMNSTMKPTSMANQTRVITHTPAGNETRTINNTPIQNSTITSSANEPLERMMNVTVVLEAVKRANDTITISKALGATPNSEPAATSHSANKVAEVAADHKSSPFHPPLTIPKVTLSKLKPVVELDALMTDDDSSPERKLPKGKKLQKKRSAGKTTTAVSEKGTAVSRPRRITRSSLISDDDVNPTPERKVLGEVNSERNRDARNALKKNMLFSPYAKESVKKKIEAFEQAVLASPVEVDSGMRLTRTKTRALAAAGDNGESMTSAPTIAQKLARKSLAKAKKISRAKEAKENEDSKENHTNLVQKLLTNDKLVQKQQLRTTPNSKIRPPMPSSVGRGPTTPSNSQSLSYYSKAMTGSRTNIVTNVDSFIQVKGSAQKPSSADKNMEERKRKQQEEDAKKKRDETLRALMEEKKKRREEKELKNRLAREAKERLEEEKRKKVEKEKEDKAKLALQLQEKQREEAEKKRMELQQRAMEKEERRKQKEQQRLQRLQEQEEMERILAEQKRKELEAERRKLAEVKAQQQAAVESMKVKAQLLAAQARKNAQLAQQKQQAPQQTNCYKIDSEPDSDSDDELRPKHEIPTWARSNYRHKHLAMQDYIPMQAIMRLFDVKKCTPDLSELFHGIDKNRLKRTSSAIWKTPPRFSMMEALND